MCSVYIIIWDGFLGLFFFQAEDGIRDLVRSRGLGDVYKRQVHDNTIHLCIADDGAGIKLENLRQSAVAKGIYSADQVAQMSDDALAQIIFMDNISTQHKVSDLAGRGIGLAAVMSETKNAGGEVLVKTVAGKGTQFLFTLPLLQDNVCLLYTSDAADERSSVDLGGRRIL